MSGRFIRCTVALLAGLFALCATRAGEPDFTRDLPAYRAQAPVTGNIRIWGNPYIPELVNAWEEGFRRHHPGVRFETRLKGTEAAMAGLYADIADVVFIGREPYRPELRAFEDWFGYAPTGIKITSGSYATQHLSLIHI